MNKNTFSCAKCLLVVILLILAGILGFVYSGWYPIGADNKHHALTYWALETLRERSIARASADISVPGDLDSPERLLAGGPDYHEMCSGCHLQPAKAQSDFTLGLYPAPPNLTEAKSGQISTTENQRTFWIIKHGIKASGMPSWAPGHDDERIWSMVAFINRLPELSASEYQILTSRTDDNGHAH
ncbi:cytochrome c [Aliiglaciecola sp. CAU 1673]|uniref:c-type cytochrome n=1 Tax=Aliiglaciecola sp. CAU 1673 TaxID=3032595 RepID=UPI0023DB14B7|nr:cytochrome c [Aliiglaciecola sp. CAU 1673]MDF2179881.1 cytochrome c [Aliiglaciecola sp. CAU 1673]